ncbi:hypothetical protein E5C31_08005 [Providencia rettgeri]|uniref:Uncharacterized protein n=1 Tax=Alcaligenes parafaecalis TaxID=171260 RepID=A0ABT3VP11_9BURK|nr:MULTISPECIES: hypothetical protein [Alcaligenes]MBY6345896.1 hypothetical protein [Providencia rettgeri]MCX5465276.1 hypothetical protein [Alcaligenes parafaecalis]QTB99393.1 hypothetical protein JYG33_15735 [Alcaligenes sp. SORT26]
MKVLLQKPILLMAVLCLPLWVIFGNFILAASASILIGMLVGMIRTLHQVTEAKKASAKSAAPASSETPNDKPN